MSGLILLSSRDSKRTPCTETGGFIFTEMNCFIFLINLACVTGCTTDPGWLCSDCACYKFYTCYKTYDDAKGFCQKLGYQLASIATEEERGFLEKVLDRLNPTDNVFWVGGARETKGEEWKWLDGSPFVFSVTRPSSSSLCLIYVNPPDDEFEAEGCDSWHRFICGNRTGTTNCPSRRSSSSLSDSTSTTSSSRSLIQSTSTFKSLVVPDATSTQINTAKSCHFGQESMPTLTKASFYHPGLVQSSFTSPVTQSTPAVRNNEFATRVTSGFLSQFSMESSPEHQRDLDFNDLLVHSSESVSILITSGHIVVSSSIHTRNSLGEHFDQAGNISLTSVSSTGDITSKTNQTSWNETSIGSNFEEMSSSKDDVQSSLRNKLVHQSSEVSLDSSKTSSLLPVNIVPSSLEALVPSNHFTSGEILPPITTVTEVHRNIAPSSSIVPAYTHPTALAVSLATSTTSLPNAISASYLCSCCRSGGTSGSSTSGSKTGEITYKKKKIQTADDRRLSARGIGGIAVSILGTLLVMVVVLDAGKLLSDLRLMYRNLRAVSPVIDDEYEN